MQWARSAEVTMCEATARSMCSSAAGPQITDVLFGRRPQITPLVGGVMRKAMRSVCAPFLILRGPDSSLVVAGRACRRPCGRPSRFLWASLPKEQFFERAPPRQAD